MVLFLLNQKTNSKDAVCYYIRTSNLQHIEPEIQEELYLFDSAKDKSKNICLILFVYKAGLCNDDFNVLRDYSKAFILGETIVPTQYCHTAIIVLIDSENNRGYYLDIQKKLSISIYAHGCKMIRKYFQS